MLEIIGGIVVILFAVLFSGMKAVKEYNALVIYRLGKVSRCVGSGLQFVVPLIETAETLDMRIMSLVVPPVTEISLDHYQVKVSALCLFQITDAKRAATKAQNVVQTATQICEIALRSAVGQHDVRHLLSDRTRIAWNLKTQLDRRFKEFGLRVVSIELNEVALSRGALQELAGRAVRESSAGKILQAKKDVSLEALISVNHLN